MEEEKSEKSMRRQLGESVLAELKSTILVRSNSESQPAQRNTVLNSGDQSDRTVITLFTHFVRCSNIL